MRPPDLQHVLELARLAVERAREIAGRVQQRRAAEQQREPRRGRVHVVGRLAHVDVIVRVDQPVLASRAAEQLGRAVGQHLVRVHVVRGAGTCLIHIHHELIAERPAENLLGGADDRVANPLVETFQCDVGFGRGFLDEHGRGDQVRGSAQAADREVLEGADGLDAVIGIGGDRVLAEGIALGPELHY